MAESLPIATSSITIINTPKPNMEGDVKAEWSDIWDDPDEGFEDVDF